MSIRFYRVDTKDRNMMEHVYRLRYQVFCLEDGILDPRDYSDGLESDEYDLNSIHFIAVDQRGLFIGTVRLVMYSEYGFPIEKHCQFYSGTVAIGDEGVAEISRLAVRQMWRNSQVTLGLWRLLYQESKNLNIQHWYAAMERSLARFLRKFAIDFKEIGPSTMYNGVRVPFITSVENIELSMAFNKPELFSYFSGGFEDNGCGNTLSSSYPRHHQLAYVSQGSAVVT